MAWFALELIRVLPRALAESMSYWSPGHSLPAIQLDPERVYGLGEKTGFLNKRGRSWMMWNTDEPDQTPSRDPLYQSIPFSIHARGTQYYGIFIDSPGPSLPEVVRQFSQITGTTFLPPIWSLGFHQSRYSYTSADRVMGIAAEFRVRQIPCDVIHLGSPAFSGSRGPYRRSG